MNPDFRALFPGAENQVYLNAAARSLLAEPVRDAISEYMDDCAMGVSDKDRLRAEVEETRAAFARLIGAEADEVAITKNVSEGLNLFAASLPWEEGDNVVVCPELEHPNNIYLWFNLKRLRGIEVRAIDPDDGRMPIDAMVRAMDERTRVVTFPTISFAPGFITDMAPLVERARRVGALTLADGAQSVGVLRTDVHELGIDALTVATQKVLLALYGFGFLYVRREVAESLVPVHVARFGIDLGDAHETAYAEGDLVYQPGAKRFDLGNYNYLGMTAARRALALIEESGIDRIEAHVRGLAARLAQGLFDLELPVVGGEPGPELAHIVSVGTIGGGRHYTTDDPDMNDLHRHLSARKMRFSIRSGVLRFSVGPYNNEADIDRVIAAAKEWTEQRETVS